MSPSKTLPKSDPFTFEPSPWGGSYAITLSDWVDVGFQDPITEIPIQQILVNPVDDQIVNLAPDRPFTDPAQTVTLAPRRGPGKEVHFWYGKTPSGANIKVFPSQNW